jgi:TetR/AcrR family transcriptional repressor of mexJK operon
MCSASARKPAPKPNAPGRPKDLGKRAAILDAAKRLFVEQGYEGVSMDQIAAAAGVSKLTVYSHFGDKDTLFAAAARAYCEQRLPAELFDPTPEVPLRERLLEIAQAFYAMVSSPEAVSGHRILCTPQMADSPVPGMFWEAGPKRVQAEFSELLQRRVDAGELEIEDVELASSQFFTLLKGELHARLVMGCGEAACRAAVRRHIIASVDMFLRAYARC